MKNLFFLLKKIKQKYFRKKIILNVFKTKYTNDCLLIYIVAPFLTKNVSTVHQNQWQAVALAKIISKLGYNVDVAQFGIKEIRLQKKYHMIIDLHPGQDPFYQNNKTEHCIQIGYMTGSNAAYSNQRESKRIKLIEQQRGVMLERRRKTIPLPAEIISNLDAIFFIGNSFNWGSYKEFEVKRLFFIKNSGYQFGDRFSNTHRSAQNFLFLSSYGQVHKGLHLLLEAFARQPECHLYICSYFRKEQDFCKEYKKELFETPNIHSIGFIDIMGGQFDKVVEKCSYCILPSASEANAGSILTAMSAGLIAIVSRDCGFEKGEVHYLDDCSVDVIADSISEFSQKDSRWISEESENARQIVASKYGQADYINSVENAFAGLLSELAEEGKIK